MMINSLLLSRAGTLVLLIVAFQVLIARVSLQRETKRRLQHALTGHSLVQISYYLPSNLCLALLLMGAAAVYILQQYYSTHFKKAFGPLLRPHEYKQLPGAFWFLLGSAITIFLIDDWMIIRYSVECLALADPMASWIGSSIRSPRVTTDSSVAGCVACFATAWVVGQLMLFFPSHRTLMIGALACTIAEALPYGNDNLNVPVLTALAVRYL